jgi:hypothetical protein
MWLHKRGLGHRPYDAVATANGHGVARGSGRVVHGDLEA